MARNRLEDCLGKTTRIPRDVKRALSERTRTLAEAKGIDPTAAAKQVVTELRDNIRSDLATVEKALKPQPQAAIKESRAADPRYQAVDQQWREDFAQWRKGTLPSNKVFDFGPASDELVLAGFPRESPITLTQSVAAQKTAHEKHPFPMELLADLPAKLRDPLLVAKSQTTPGALVALTEIEHEGQNLLVAVHFKPSPQGPTISSIRSVYPKRSEVVLQWIKQGEATYFHKERAQSWLHRIAGSDAPRAWSQLQAIPNVKTNEDVVKEGPLFSRPEPAPAPELAPAPAPAATGQSQEAKAVAAQMREQMPRGPKIDVVTGEEIAREFERRGDPETAAAIRTQRPEAYYDESRDRVVVIPENVRLRPGERTFADAVRRAIMHEAPGHGGLARLFRGGPLERQYIGIIEAAWARFSGQDLGEEFAARHGYRTLEDLARWYGYDPATPEGRASIMEEHWARLAEDPNPPRWFDAVLSEITRLLRAMGFNAWTDADTRVLLARARDQLGMDAHATRSRIGSLRFSRAMNDISGNPEKERGFVTSVKAAYDVLPSVKERVHGMYTPITNAATQEAARERINKNGIEATMAELMATQNPSALDNATMIDLTQRLQGAGREEEAAALYMNVAPKATSQGQAIQILSTLSKFNPVAIRAYAEQAIAEDVKKNPRLNAVLTKLTQTRSKLAAARRRLANRTMGSAAARGALERVERHLTANPGATPGRTVRQVMAEVNAAMRDVLVSRGAREKEATLKALTSSIVERTGMAAEAAQSVAETVQREFEAEQEAARKLLLKQMAERPTRELPKSKLEELMKKNNEGKLEDTDFFAELSKAYGIPAWTMDLSKKIQALQREYERALAMGEDGAPIAFAKGAQMYDAIHELIPYDVFARVRAIQNMAMLLNPKTSIRNLGGNVMLFAADVAADSVSRWAVDPMLSFVTGKRTRRSVDVWGRLRGLARPVEDFVDGYRFARDAGAERAASLKEGAATMLTLARLTSRGKFDISQIKPDDPASHVFSHAFARAFEDGLATMLSVPDRAFHYAAYQASLLRQERLAKAEGKQLLAPTPEMLEEALLDANRAIFQDENKVSTALGGIRKYVNKLTGSEQYGLGSVILPFTQVPGSVLMRGIEWSPLGFIRSLGYEAFWRPIRGQEFRQKEFVDSFSRALLGSGGLVATGIWLAAIGVLTSLGEEDDKLRAFQDASGLGKYRINISALKRAMLSGNWWSKQQPQDGDLTVNYDWATPLAMPVAAGGEIQKRYAARQHQVEVGLEPEGTLGDTLAVLKASVATLADQPLLQGIERLAAGSVGEGNSLLTATFEAGYDIPGAFLPVFIKQINQMMDNQLREIQAGDRFQQAVARFYTSIPGLSDKYPPRFDVFGEAVQRYQYGGNSFVNVFLNPATIRVVRMNPAIREMNNLFSVTSDKGVLPEKAKRSIQVAGQRVELTNEQISDYQRIAGTLTINSFTLLAASPKYAAAPPGAKAAGVEQLLKEVHQATLFQVLRGHPAIIEEIRKQALQKAREQQRLMQPVPMGP
jgi:hypothetical protein